MLVQWGKNHITQIIVGLLIVITCIAFGMRPIDDNDIGIHVRMGSTIWSQGHIPAGDHHSFTADGAPYLDHEWLPQVILFKIDQLWGIKGLVILKGFLVLLAIGLVIIGSNARLIAIIPILACWSIIAIERVQTRPHVFAWVFLGGLLAAQRFNKRAIIAFILVIWANSHASFLLALLMIMIWVFDQWYQSRDRKWLIWAVTFIAAPCVNPFGPKIYLFATQISEHIDFVSEWKPYALNVIDPWIIFGLGMFLLADLIQNKENRFSDMARLLVLGGFAFSASRHGPEAILYLTPTLSYRLDRLFGKLTEKSTYSASAILSIILISNIVYLIQKREAFQMRLDHEALPVASTDFIMRHQLHGPMFNDYNFGGYLLWKAYPEHRVFVDGRLEVYGSGGELDDYLKISRAEPGFDRLLARYHIAFAIVRADRPIAQALFAHSQWELVYFDYNSAIYVRRGTMPALRRIQFVTPWGNRDRSQVDAAIDEVSYLVGENPLFFGGYKVLAFLLYRKGDTGGARLALGRYLALHPEGVDVRDTQQLMNALGESL